MKAVMAAIGVRLRALDEARRIATNIAKLPRLLGVKRNSGAQE
jgi:hypothetical protein